MVFVLRRFVVLVLQGSSKVLETQECFMTCPTMSSILSPASFQARTAVSNIVLELYASHGNRKLTSHNFMSRVISIAVFL